MFVLCSSSGQVCGMVYMNCRDVRMVRSIVLHELTATSSALKRSLLVVSISPDQFV